MQKRAVSNRIAPGVAATVLQGRLKSVFREAGQRGRVQSTSQAFALTPQDKKKMAVMVAETYIQAKAQSYSSAVQTTARLLKPTKAYTPDRQQADTWANQQVESISSTYDDQRNAAEKKAAGVAVVAAILLWLASFVQWKVTQIVLVVWWSGVSAGTQDWLDDSGGMDDLTDDGDAMAQIAVQVVPSTGMCDICDEYAGNTYDISEIDNIPDFPIHPGCQHSIQIITI